MKTTLHHTTVLLALLLTFFLGACIEEYTPKFKDAEQEVLIVEGGIHADSLCIFHLGLAVTMDQEDYNLHKSQVTDAEICVRGSDGTLAQGRPHGGNGVYAVHVPQLDPATTYWLEIRWHDRTYQSTPLEPAYAPDISSWELTQFLSAADMQLRVTTCNTPHIQYASWSLDECWKIVTPNKTELAYVPEFDSIRTLRPEEPRTNVGWVLVKDKQVGVTNSGEYGLDSLENHLLYSFPKRSDRLQTRYFVRLRQIGITKAEYEYEMLRKQQNEGMGDLFSPLPSELPGNIVCNTDRRYRAVGFVGVHARPVIEERYIEGGFGSGYINQRGQPEIIEPQNARLVSQSLLYQMGYLPYYTEPQTEWTAWIEAWGVDARRWGANLERPAFWKD